MIEPSDPARRRRLDRERAQASRQGQSRSATSDELDRTRSSTPEQRQLGAPSRLVSIVLAANLAANDGESSRARDEIYFFTWAY